MNFNLQLQEELEKLTPDWEWRCDAAGQLPLSVYATSRRNGHQTSPVLVTRSLCENVAPGETAQYIYKILSRSEPTLARKIEPATSSSTNVAFLGRLFTNARYCAIRWAQGIKGMFVVVNPLAR